MRSASRRGPKFRRSLVLAASGTLVLAVLAGCSEERDAGASGAPAGAGTRAVSPSPSPAPGTGTASSPPILAPGAPGEEASTIAPEDVPSADPWNHTDAAFVQMMIPHHGQALQMSRLARERAVSRRIKTLASRIEGAQGPEIVAMAAWLQAKGLEVPRAAEDPGSYDHGAHGHTGMAGMLTPEQMAELEAARGRRFDRLFLRSMIRHHRGAIEMAESVLVEGTDAQAMELATDVIASQTAEIALMQEMLRA